MNEPGDIQAAQMSVPFAVALTVSRGSALAPGFALTVDDFERALGETAVMDLSRRVECVLDDDAERVSTAELVGAKVALRLVSGAERKLFVAAPQGSASRPYATADHVDRFRHEFARRFQPAACNDLVAAIRNFALSADVNELARRLVDAA